MTKIIKLWKNQSNCTNERGNWESKFRVSILSPASIYSQKHYLLLNGLLLSAARASAWQSSSLVPLPLSEKDNSAEHTEDVELSALSEQDEDVDDDAEVDDSVSSHDSLQGCSCTIGTIYNDKRGGTSTLNLSCLLFKSHIYRP